MIFNLSCFVKGYLYNEKSLFVKCFIYLKYEFEKLILE